MLIKQIKTAFVVSRFILLCLLVCSHLPLRAATPDTLRFVVIDLPPYGCKQSFEAVPACMHNAYAMYLSKALGLDIDIFNAPPQRARFSIENENADFLITINHDEMRQFAEPVVVVSSPTFMVLAKRGINTESDLQGKSFALIRGGDYLTEINENPNLNRVFTSSHAQSIALLLKGRVDAAVAPKDIIDILINQSKYSLDDFEHPIAPWTIPAILYCRKGVCDNAMRDKIRKATVDITASQRQAWLQQAMEHASKIYSVDAH